MVMLMVAVDMMAEPQASFDALFKTHISLSLASGALHRPPMPCAHSTHSTHASSENADT
eukprot:COSAG02_NODE_3946_length_5997_cov_6.308579_2_plen_59_part_00